MKAIISSTYDDQYLFFLPITTWCWNKLNVDVICFMPSGYATIERERGFIKGVYPDGNKRSYLVNDTLVKNNLSCRIHYFNAPKHKQATYAQCSRLYGACLDLPDDEILISSDIDMTVFKLPPIPSKEYDFTVFGSDLTPAGQYPICYVSGMKWVWKAYFYAYKTFQVCLDNLLGDIECENFRGNYWAKDQEHLFNSLSIAKVEHFKRAREGTQFASLRYDRDDAYILDRLSPETIDFHMNRPGYEDGNFEIILKILQYHYPHDDLSWMKQYQEEYKRLL